MRDTPPQTDAGGAQATPDTALDDKVTAQIRKLYGYFDGYQQACRIPLDAQVDRRTFESSFDRRVMRNLFKELGDPYIESQAGFEKALLSHLRIIEICVEKRGRAQVFWTSMNWHLDQWRAKIKESEDFAVAETERVEGGGDPAAIHIARHVRRVLLARAAADLREDRIQSAWRAGHRAHPKGCVRPA
jgi:hypothetical protein